MPAHPALRVMAPLLGLAVAEVVFEVLEGFFKEPDPVKEGDAVALDAPEDVEPTSVDCPEISAKIEEEKVPVIPVRVNLEEKANEG